jgi:hypothetical protein
MHLSSKEQQCSSGYNGLLRPSTHLPTVGVQSPQIIFITVQQHTWLLLNRLFGCKQLAKLLLLINGPKAMNWR